MKNTVNGNELKVEIIDDGVYQGLAITLNGEIVTRVEENTQERKVSCYVYGDTKQEDFTHKEEIR